MKAIYLNDPQVQLGRSDVLTFLARSNSVAAAITGAAFTTYQSGVQVSTGTATKSSTIVGQFTVAFAGTEFDEVRTDLRIHLVTTFADGAVFESNHQFMCVQFKAVTSVNDAMLAAYVPGLTNELWSGTTSYKTQIQQAFTEVLYKLRGRGFDGSMLVDMAQLDLIIVWKTLELIFFGFSRAEGDIWWTRYVEAKAKYDQALQGLVLDVSLSGDVDAFNRSSFATVRLMR